MTKELNHILKDKLNLKLKCHNNYYVVSSLIGRWKQVNSTYSLHGVTQDVMKR